MDQAHTEIVLLSSKIEGMKLEQVIGSNLPDAGTNKGASDEKTAKEIDNALISRQKDKSLIINAYRDSAKVVLHSSPFEIIKKSKRRTRELHTAFSIVLWSGAAILYVIVNYLLGYREFTLNPAKLSSTWLIFVFAALAECLVEIFFCKKELAVLNENIDLRQIDPNKKDGDLNLRSYQKSLTRKIRIMSSAVMWISLTIIFFVGGYMFYWWNILWIVFLLGIFVEFLLNFIKKLKKNDIS